MSDLTLPVMRGKYVAPKENRKAAGSRLSAHFKYIEHRTYGDQEKREDRSIFSADEENIQRKNAVDDVMRYNGQGVRYHKIVLSPASYERIDNYRQWTRDIMTDLEERKGIHLHWYAVVQAHPRENIDTPHIHLVLAGAGEDRDTGELKTVRMDWQRDYQLMRQSGREHSNFEFYQQIEQTIKEIDTHDDTTRTSPDLEHQYGGIER